MITTINLSKMYCFDADGTMVHKIKNGLKVKINEDYIVATYLKVYADGSYSIQLDTYDIKTNHGMVRDMMDSYVVEFTPVVDG